MRKSAELFGLAGLLLLVVQTWSALWGLHRLPEQVPTHFDAAGTPNAWGSPNGMILLPVVAIGVYLLITIVTRFPASFNYPIRVTPINRARLEQVTLNMLAWIKAELAWLFAVLQWAFVRAAGTGDGSIFPKVVPAFIVVIFGTIGLGLVSIVRAARSQ